MAQKNSGNRRQAPAYSADTLALKYMSGLALIALGVVMFLAVILQMKGVVFQGLRGICFGLCGGLAAALPVLSVWAGVLLIWSAQRRAPVRPWLFAFLGFWGVCSFIVMVTRTRSGEDYFVWLMQSGTDNSWLPMIRSAYMDCSAHCYSGGAMGMTLAWPLWRVLGSFLGAAILVVGVLFCALLAVNLTPSRIRDLVTGQAGRRKEQQADDRARADAEQLAWQQEQVLRQQQARQQQAYILEQQQQAQPTSPMASPQATGPVRNNPAQSSVAAWQEQNTMQQTAARVQGYQSQILSRPPEAAEESRKREKGHISKIFGRKDPYDGLSEAEPVRPAMAEQPTKPARRTVTGQELTPPVTEWNGPTLRAEQEAARRAEEEAAREAEKQEKRARKETRPQEVPAEPRRAEPEPQERPLPKTPPAEKKPPVSTSDWSRQVEERMKEQRKEEPAALSDRAEEPPRVNVVTQPNGVVAYKPELHLNQKPLEQEEEGDGFWMPTPYVYPPITDLNLPKAGQEDTTAEDEMRSRRLEETLASFRVQARVVNVTHGPAISRFELELAAGTKVNKVAELEKDIAYGMEATSVRIEAPIPGKSLVGVEVPNRKVATVTLREVLQSEKMQSAKSILTVALGKDIAGTPIVCDLAKMPHMLIAGQTGSGKSVCINTIINSLLYRASPDEVRLILVDPKVVELQCYNGIPHLLIPVVNDPHKAAAALAWAVAEMMARYDKFSERKVRNLEGYNNAIGPHEKPMERIVIIIDELADLMMVCKKDVEEYICRLTQLARAAGIHLIVATQRPSVDVITGLIKANIPSRIAFKTASSIDSRTILDRNGSEQLLGWGDMLYLPTGAFAPTRVQGCFLSDDEVNRIAAHVREANPSTYDPNILEKLEELSSGAGMDAPGADLIGGTAGGDGADGGLFEQAVEMAIADGQISTSTLQRRLKIGYARAGRLTDEMEERGIVAAKDGSKPRKCLITREEWEELKKATEGMT